MKKQPRLQDSDLRLARLFQQIVASGGLAAAEEALGAGRSTLSRQLQAFETRLGLTLCQRGRSGFRLTPEGAEVLDHVEQLLGAVQDFSNNVAGLRRALGARLKVGMIDCSAGDPANPLGAMFRQLQLQAPEVEIEVTMGSAKDLEAALLADKLHVATYPDYGRHPDLAHLELYHESVGLFAGPGHPAAQGPRSEAEIRAMPLVHRMQEPGDLGRRKAGFPHGVRAAQTEAVLALVRSGCYLGFLPRHLGAGLTELCPEVFAYRLPICLTWRPGRPGSRLMQTFLRQAQGAAGR